MRKFINLTSATANLNESEIRWTKTSFPDGQQNITIIDDVSAYETVQIKSRMNSFLDLELIICATKALHGLGVRNVELFVPYFLGSRSDRKFTNGSTNYLKDVICPIINAQNYTRVIVLDPHSYVLEACINNFEKFSNVGLVSHALVKIDTDIDDIVFVSPDAGAQSKIYSVASVFENTSVITASKVRSTSTGEIVRTEVPALQTPRFTNKKFLIIDDICDGGRTFTELSKAIKEQLPNAHIYLCVTHGIFSAGFELLSKEFEGIFCTNSYYDIDEHTAISNKVYQLNIF